MTLYELVCIILILFMNKTAGVINNLDKPGEPITRINKEAITKITLTQKGYIQFLRYIEHVPPISDYTFCIWVKSYNLTHAHPLLSYSKHEEERLIRMWISNKGKKANLEIHGHAVFEVPINFKEHQWYHVCQSWSSSQALWELFLNGKRIHRGFSEKLKGLSIKSGGDIVVGQEYTDFDKGLDDGIEGEIYGFNFVLSPTSLNHFVHKKEINQPYVVDKIKAPLYYAPDPNSNLLLYNIVDNTRNIGGHVRIIQSHHVGQNTIPYNYQGIPRGNKYGFVSRNSLQSRISRAAHVSKPLGLRLVELSHDCRIGKGGPLSGKKVLINWAKTTARVFGGAIVKHITPFCIGPI